MQKILLWHSCNTDELMIIGTTGFFVSIRWVTRHKSWPSLIMMNKLHMHQLACDAPRVKVNGKHKITVESTCTYFILTNKCFHKKDTQHIIYKLSTVTSVGWGRDCLKLELFLDLVFQLSGLRDTLPGDGINESLGCRSVSEMSTPTFHPLTNLIWD